MVNLDYDNRHKTSVSRIRSGDRVYVKRQQVRSSKLEKPYIGPFRVIGVRGNAADLEYLATRRIYRYHLAHLARIQENMSLEEDKSVCHAYAVCDWPESEFKAAGLVRIAERRFP